MGTLEWVAHSSLIKELTALHAGRCCGGFSPARQQMPPPLFWLQADARVKAQHNPAGDMLGLIKKEDDRPAEPGEQQQASVDEQKPGEHSWVGF